MIIGTRHAIVSAGDNGYCCKGGFAAAGAARDADLSAFRARITGIIVRYFGSSLIAGIVLMALATLFAQAATEPVLTPPGWSLSLLRPGVQTDIAALRAGAHAGDFVPLPERQLRSAPNEVQWLRVSLEADWHERSPPVLSVHDTGFREIEVYAPPEYRESRQSIGAANLAPRFSRRALATLLPMDLSAEQPTWIRIDAAGTGKSMNVRLGDLASYQAEDLQHVRRITLFSSVQLAMVLVGLCLWLALRDPVFFWFIGYASTQLVYQTLTNGELFDLVGGTALADVGRELTILAAMVSAAMAITFILAFCDLRQQTPRLARALGTFRWPLLVAVPIQAFFGPNFHAWLPRVVNVLVLGAALLAIVTVSLVAWRGNRAARFFLVAWMPQVVFTALRILQLLGAWPLPPWLEYGYPFTMAFASIVLVLGLADDTLNVRRERDVAHHLANHDGLTGTLNRRTLISRLGESLAGTRERSAGLALLFFDIDHFKSINDQHGHLAGDACLRAVAQCLSTNLRASQFLGRYGGEEFIAVLPDIGRDQAMHLAERLRRLVEHLVVETDGTTLRLTVSIGVAFANAPNEPPDPLIARADRALYRAKAEGRNRICLAEDTPFLPTIASPA